ncbi:TPA: hypothetical protein DDW69_04750 [candidate division CPR2 bacterium]|uniref:Uncharacterized protein n=1 Tax=candidate division CPR2 bacterium GW2011_GWC1_41_48 TaxID=1618344 RepID=A0A0G0W8P6_UNCC2|nr:MAG: hypothetical protein UT47_C0002G0171 [candidate division CPR2 bacterium GW2011_GWC2_39_35]KKR28309.1 MAG: hypothetical protein UT60_C0023G0017 [candidate division CPR2 bacterium GW2011_GWD2_39_7]KKS09355.1 MAG: hypothetical protein UU65_C0002G0133 [candidate division CPR2 bacterium GW2011_GWC1_41_48]OGB72451.1 MAG: hypothetical protein A2Y26_01800 [candidate division CPR2 bacterium GWD2_39_7]HBG82110.1 hypothetical protein [candidate division CPR2 bacterium]
MAIEMNMDINDVKEMLDDESENIRDSIEDMQDLVGSLGGEVEDNIKSTIHHLHEALTEIDNARKKL